jgi:protein-tyrosine phosphatase
MNDAQRIVSFPSLLNARDLGGYPTLDGSQTRWRSLLRADDLVQLTPAGLEAMAAFGIETVIDLRWPKEVLASPSPVATNLSHVRYHQISLLARTAEEWDRVREECTKETWKCTVLDLARSELRSVLQTIADSSSGPLLFHCVAGKDRTGIIAALMLAVADVDPEAIARDYAMSAVRLRDAYLERYSHQRPERILEEVRCPEQGVYNMLEYLKQAGGVRAYLERIGLEGGEIERLRARLRQ